MSDLYTTGCLDLLAFAHCQRQTGRQERRKGGREKKEREEEEEEKEKGEKRGKGERGTSPVNVSMILTQVPA